LVVVSVVPVDERDIVDIDPEKVKLPRPRMPAELPRNHVRDASAYRSIFFRVPRSLLYFST